LLASQRIRKNPDYAMALNKKRTFQVKVVVTVSLSLFIASLGMPALEFRQHSPVRGLTTLLWGWWGVFTFDFPWLANPAYFAAVFFGFLKQRAVAMVCCAIALGLGALSHWVREWYFNEAGGTPIDRLGAAYYLWMASFAALLLGMAFARIAQTRNPVDSKPA
jgi:hypothetical protein